MSWPILQLVGIQLFGRVSGWCFDFGMSLFFQAAIGTTCYIALDKGALSWGPTPHVLVIPIDHHSSSAALPVSTLAGEI